MLCCALVCGSVILFTKQSAKIKHNQDLSSSLTQQLKDSEAALKAAEDKQAELERELETERQKNSELTQEVDSLNKKLAARAKQPNIVSLAAPSSFKSYMDYRTITNQGSYAYKLQQQAVTDENGLRKIDDYYCVAMGTHYGKVGDKLYIETDEGACWKVILADIKSDKHTDSTNSYTLSNGCMMEFIVDTRQMPGSIKRSGTVNGLGFQGNITVVKKI